MAQVRFNLRTNKNKGSTIQFIYRLDGDNKKVVISTRLHVNPKHWNPKNMRLRDSAPDNIKINSILDRWETLAREVIYESKSQQRPHSISSFKNALKEKWGITSNKQHNNEVLKYFEDFITLKKNTVSNSTLKLYTNARAHLTNYIKIKRNGSKIEFQDCTERFFIDFIDYLRDEDYGDLEDNTINKILKRIKAVFNHATTKGVNTLKDYQSRNCSITYVKQPKFYLNEEELDQIRNLKLSKGSRLYNVRAMFLVGYNTGQRYCDFSKFDINMVITKKGCKKFIHKKSQKGGNYVKIPVNKELATILQEYKGFPKFISAQKFNKYLGELCEKAGISEMVSKNEKGKQIMYPKYELIGSHICRRSFATNTFKKGIAPTYLMKITGHTTIKQFMEYICIDDEEGSLLLAEHPFFQ